MNESGLLREVSLKKSFCKPLKDSNNFSFILISPTIEVEFTAHSYGTMFEWISVLNSTSSALAPELNGQAVNLWTEIQYEVFEREYYELLRTLEDNPTYQILLIEANFLARPSNNEDFQIERGVLRNDTLVKYEDENLKSAFQISGATPDKIIERLAGVYGPDSDFIHLIISTHRSFIDPVLFFMALLSRMDPISKEYTFNSWKSVIRLRSISVILKWMATSWRADFQSEVMQKLVLHFLQGITMPFTNDTERDKGLAIYQKKFDYLLTALIPKSEDDLENIESRKTVVGRKTVVSLNTSFSLTSFSQRSTTKESITKESILSVSSDDKKKIEFADVEADEFVNALTLQEHARLHNITTTSLTVHLWTSPKEDSFAASVKPITDAVDSFNRVIYQDLISVELLGCN